MSAVHMKRLAAAFAAMEEQGLLTRQGFGCCVRCATLELTAMITAREKAGAIYYHTQDAARLSARGDGVFLGFLAYRGDAAPADEVRAVGAAAVACLKAQKLRVRWNGSAETRIWVELRARARKAPR